MCIILFSWQPETALPLQAIANRDEQHARPAEPARWRGPLFCGLDRSAGGTWMGMTRDGRFAAVTNFREPVPTAAPRSRGDLPMGFLQGQATPEAYARQVEREGALYGPMNLLVGDRQQLWYVSNRGQPAQPVAPGLHGLCNHHLDTPWPKVLRARAALGQHTGALTLEQALTILTDPWQPPDDQLPDTGIPRDLERLVSSVFIRAPLYGTRASTLVQVPAQGEPFMVEQRWTPEGQPDGPPAWSRAAPVGAVQASAAAVSRCFRN